MNHAPTACMTFRVEWLFPHLVAIGLSLAIAIASWKRPHVGRAMFAALFLWAGLVNATTALRTPEVYLDYGPLTESAIYRAIIEGPFARHITLYVLIIAAAQLCISAGMLLHGRATRLALMAAIVFLVAIAPLGIGAGFPSTLIMAGGALVLLRVRFPRSLPVEIRDGLRRHRSGRSTA